MDPLSDEILHCENKAFTINSLSVSSRDSTMIKVGEVTKVPTSHLLILAQCHWATTVLYLKSSALVCVQPSVQGC